MLSFVMLLATNTMFPRLRSGRRRHLQSPLLLQETVLNLGAPHLLHVAIAHEHLELSDLGHRAEHVAQRSGATARLTFFSSSVSLKATREIASHNRLDIDCRPPSLPPIDRISIAGTRNFYRVFYHIFDRNEQKTESDGLV